MPTKEEWVARFEEHHGRKPSPQEFIEGKKSHFDVSQFLPKEEVIYDVAEGEAVETEPVSSVEQVEQVYDMAEAVEEVVPASQEAVEEIASEETLAAEKSEQLEPIHPVTEQASNVNPSAKEQWVAAFEKYVGRKPSPQEFVLGKNSDFALTSINQFLTSSTPTEKPVRKPLSVGRKILYAVGGVVIVSGVAGYMFGTQYFSKQAVAERYLQAVKQDPTKAITEYEVWSDTKEKITKEQLTYLNVDQRQTVSADDVLDEDHMVQAGQQFLVFPNWKVAVQPVEATVTVNTKGLALSVNGKQIEKSTGDSYKKKLDRLYPGTYSFVAKGKVEGQDVEVSSEENLTKNSTVDLAVKYLSFTVQSNLSDGDLYVGSKKIGTLSNGRFDVSNLAVTSAASVYVKKDFSENNSVKTDTYSISEISDGDTITVDASGVLDRDVADRVITAAYGKLSSYSYNHTTPDNLKDVFAGGADNNFYTDVKETIDTNTTGAKNRSADSISFSDIDVTKVTQTGPKTYTVEFTVVYDFYYSYKSKFKTSGDIIQKLAWSANIEYVGDKDSDGSNSSDYRITSNAGASSLLDTKNTVD